MSALNLILGKLDGVEVGTKEPEKVVEKEEEKEVIDLFGLPAPAEEKTEEPVENTDKEEEGVDSGEAEDSEEAEDLLSGLIDGMVFSY